MRIVRISLLGSCEQRLAFMPISFCLSLELLNAFADGIRELLPMLVAIVFFTVTDFRIPRRSTLKVIVGSGVENTF